MNKSTNTFLNTQFFSLKITLINLISKLIDHLSERKNDPGIILFLDLPSLPGYKSKINYPARGA
jgi:hypothetical protein